jgi:hypothetical protein
MVGRKKKRTKKEIKNQDEYLLSLHKIFQRLNVISLIEGNNKIWINEDKSFDIHSTYWIKQWFERKYYNQGREEIIQIIDTDIKYLSTNKDIFVQLNQHEEIKKCLLKSIKGLENMQQKYNNKNLNEIISLVKKNVV